MPIEIKDPVKLPIDDIHPNEWNPNEQSVTIFNELGKEIEQDGFDTPIHVVYWPGHEREAATGRKQYKIVDGEHRWRIAKNKQMEEISCVIHDNWDEEEQMKKTIRRNQLTGQLNPTKFTEMLRKLEGRGFKPSEQYRELGFESYEDMARHLAREREEKSKAWADALNRKVDKDKEVVESLSDVINTVLRNHGDTVDKSYVFFNYGGKMQLLFLMEPETYKLTEEMIAYLRANNMNMNQFVFDALKRRLKGVISEPQDEATLEASEQAVDDLIEPT